MCKRTGWCLDYADRFMKWVKQNDEPFGGLSIIYVGDMLQCQIGQKFCFAQCWTDVMFTELTAAHQQDIDQDPFFTAPGEMEVRCELCQGDWNIVVIVEKFLTFERPNCAVLVRFNSTADKINNAIVKKKFEKHFIVYNELYKPAAIDGPMRTKIEGDEDYFYIARGSRSQADTDIPKKL
ncbi:ATP-dependent DNA helicase [Caenorhabditis elegans]|uniref:ATP-dependent DNA helicase n=1 Tax=Caenorhabditis elegans TaxID=6239 RepID=L8E6M6_CAEEL|nr:ATP-dependent DNA helicase [Caenorhabditis elegans]CCQ25699.1 ATP-dependent DNA helicase [Caenorhabditis elegans]|eukprot:NP_001263912.1 ATP-dependent DNA helicase [Caenorhabditis elegans]